MFELTLAIIMAFTAFYLSKKDDKNSDLYKLLRK